MIILIICDSDVVDVDEDHHSHHHHCHHKLIFEILYAGRSRKGIYDREELDLFTSDSNALFSLFSGFSTEESLFSASVVSHSQREREKERESDRDRETETESVCVCVREREREEIKQICIQRRKTDCVKTSNRFNV